MNDVMKLCDRVREVSYEIHLYHAHGHLEKIYENALAHRLRKVGLDVKQQHPLTVRDEDGAILGEYYADLLVEGRLIVELKACKTLAEEHTAQILGYLRASGFEHGLLINFGSAKFQINKFAMRSKPNRSGGASWLGLLLSVFSHFAFFAFFRG